MATRSLISRLLFRARDYMSREMFTVLRKYCRGQVLDIGGADFVRTAVEQNVPFDQWTILEPDASPYYALANSRVNVVEGDGCNLTQAESQYDTVLCIQVAEHVFSPFRLFQEAKRVLKPGGYSIWVVPWTGNLHGAPYHYQNVSRFWFLEAAKQAEVEVVELKALGGAWSTIASRLLYYCLQMARWGSMSFPDARRNIWFYLLSPLMLLYIIAGIPVCLLLSLGDMEEEANNHLLVFRKR